MQEQIIGGIYFLECPVTGVVKYVGQTSNFKIRRSSHLSGNVPSKRLFRWCTDLREQGLRPIFRMVYITDNQTMKDELEIRFIEEYADTVMNVRSGGFASRLWRKTYKDQYFLTKVP